LYISEIITEDENNTSEHSPESFPLGSLPDSGEYEVQLLDKIDDAVLKMVFPGLYR
jgi:hypothetical protein